MDPHRLSPTSARRGKRSPKVTLSPRIRITTPKLSRSSSFNKIIREVLTASTTSAAPLPPHTPPPLLSHAVLSLPFDQKGSGSHEIDLGSADFNQLCLDMKMTSVDATPIGSPRGVAPPQPYIVPMTPLAPLNSVLSSYPSVPMSAMSSNPYYPAFTPTPMASYPSVPSQVPSQAPYLQPQPPYFAMYPPPPPVPPPALHPYYPAPNLRQAKHAQPNYVRTNFSPHGSLSKCVADRRIRAMVISQNGSRFIQSKYAELSRADKAAFLEQMLFVNAVQHGFVQLAQHVFANWVCQLLFVHGERAQRARIVGELKGHVVELCLNSFGCRLIQKVIAAPNSPDDVALKRAVLSEIRGHTLLLLRSNNGHHCVQRALESCPSQLSQFVLDEIAPQLMELSADPFGCQIIEMVLQKFDFECAGIRQLVAMIQRHVCAMSRHKYGNYIIQDIIESAPETVQDKLFKAIFEHIGELGCNKYSSNVVEKSIYLAAQKRRRKLVRLMVGEDDTEGRAMGALHRLVCDKFGNYVVQTLLMCSGRKDRQKLMAAIHNMFPDLDATPYGRHISNAIAKCMKQQMEEVPPNAN